MAKILVMLPDAHTCAKLHPLSRDQRIVKFATWMDRLDGEQFDMIVAHVPYGVDARDVEGMLRDLRRHVKKDGEFKVYW